MNCSKINITNIININNFYNVVEYPALPDFQGFGTKRKGHEGLMYCHVEVDEREMLLRSIVHQAHNCGFGVVQIKNTALQSYFSK